MADEDKVDGAAEGGKKSGLMKILVFVFAGILLVGASVAVTLYMTGFFDVKKEENSKEVIENLEKTMYDENGKPIEVKGPEKETRKFPDPKKFNQSYQDFKTKFTVNIPSTKKYVQFALSVMTHYDNRVLDNVDKHETALRSAVIAMASLEPYETYQTNEGLESFRNRIRDELNRVLVQYEDFGGIEEVFFTELVVQ